MTGGAGCHYVDLDLYAIGNGKLIVNNPCLELSASDTRRSHPTIQASYGTQSFMGSVSGRQTSDLNDSKFSPIIRKSVHYQP
jgi:hypothetical protein